MPHWRRLRSRPTSRRRKASAGGGSRPLSSTGTIGSCSRRIHRCRLATRRTAVRSSSAVLGRLADELNFDRESLLALGPRASRPTPANPVGLTPLAIRASRSTNAVSARHGSVARGMWHEMFPAAPSTRCRSPTSRTACTFRRGWLPRCAVAHEHLGEGWETRERPMQTCGRGSTRSPTRSCGRLDASCGRAARRHAAAQGRERSSGTG